tara:strand:- start:19459 stop:19920 length:462 start_codon:yes stop_codon:yes gene_type:complete
MITVTLSADCQIEFGGKNIYTDMNVREISTPANVDSKRGKSSIWGIPFVWCFGDAEAWDEKNTVVLSYVGEGLPVYQEIEGVNELIGYEGHSIMGGDTQMVNQTTGAQYYPTNDGGQSDLDVDIFRMSNRGKQIIERFFPSIGVVEVTGLPIV